MSSLLNKLGSFLLGEDPEVNESIQEERQRQQARVHDLAKSQRNALLDELDASISALLEFAHAQEDTVEQNEHSELGAAIMEGTEERKFHTLLNDNISMVNTVCTHLDRCVHHGLLPLDQQQAVDIEDVDPSTTVQFFGIVKWTCTRVEALRYRQALEALQSASKNTRKSASKMEEVVTSSVEAELPRHVRAYFAAVRSANSVVNVQTDIGKARSFLRQAMNMHALRASLGFILAETNIGLLTSYYHEYALFRQRDDVKMFLHLISFLDDLPFSFVIDDMRLDEDPSELPFSKPMPKPRADASIPEAPKLISSEDMASGRVRLCEIDETTGVLAQKLASEHHIRETYDTIQGGNPLAETLRQAATSKRLEDASAAVLRFLEVGYPDYYIFGTKLSDVMCNPFLCGMARFETAMGLPDLVEACFSYLYTHLDTPGIFQVHLEADHVMQLRDDIEEFGGLTRNMTLDPHEVVAILLQYLWELPDSLLTEERLQNLRMCGTNGSNEHLTIEEKTMILKVLVNDLPWYAKPIWERLCHLVKTLLKPFHATKNGLTAHAIAHCFAPILLRRKHEFPLDEYADASSRKYPVGFQHSLSVRLRLVAVVDDDGLPDREFMSSQRRSMSRIARDTEANVTVLSLLFDQQSFILQDFRDELVIRQDVFKKKVSWMETVRYKLSETIDVDNPLHLDLLKRLRTQLLHQDGDESRSMNMTKEELLDPAQWKSSGFHTDNVLGNFRGGGLLALECLVHFLEEYPEKSKSMMERNCEPGGDRYPFPVACINVMRMLMSLLMVDASPEKATKLVLPAIGDGNHTLVPPTTLQLRVAERVSRTPFWFVFDDTDAFFKMHSMAFMLLDFHWVHSGATQMGFQPVLDATRRQMGWLLEQGPRSVHEMWTKWVEVRGSEASKYCPVRVDTSVADGDHADKIESDEATTHETKRQTQERAQAF